MRHFLVLLLASTPLFAEESSAKLVVSSRAWKYASAAHERLAADGAKLPAAARAELARDWEEIEVSQAAFRDGTNPLGLARASDRRQLRELESNEAKMLEKIRAFASQRDHGRDELKDLESAQEVILRGIRDHQLHLDVELAPRIKLAESALASRSWAFSRDVGNAFRKAGLIRRADFDRIAGRLMKTQDYGPDAAGHTHCNEFAHDFAGAAFAYEGLRGKNANEIADFLRTKADGWQAVLDGGTHDFLPKAMAEAQRLANEGYLVLASYHAPGGGEQRGHVAVVLPGELKRSEIWGLDVPDTAQAGSIVFARAPLTVGFERHKDMDLLLYVRKP